MALGVSFDTPLRPSLRFLRRCCEHVTNVLISDPSDLVDLPFGVPISDEIPNDLRDRELFVGLWHLIPIALLSGELDEPLMSFSLR